MNDYEVFLRLKTDRDQLTRKMRDAQFIEDATRIEKAQPRRLRFHLRLPHLNGFRFFRLRRQTTCTHEPLSAH